MTVAAVRAGRVAAEALMVDEGTAARPTGTSYTGGVDTTTTTPLFTSRCKLQTTQIQARTAQVGAREAVTVTVELHLPVDTTPLQVDDLWTLTTPGPGSLAQAGAVYRVLAPFAKTYATARRYQVEEVVA